MNLALWIAQWVLGAALAIAGVFKLTLPAGQAMETFPWSVDHPTLFVVTSALDTLGGLGLLLPALTRVFPWLTWMAAMGVGALMAGAVVFHLLRGEASEIVPNVVLAAIAAFIAWGRLRRAPIVRRLPAPKPFAEPLPLAQPPAGMTITQLPTGTYATPAAFAVRGGSIRDRRDFASTAVLIEHPQGDLLIDAGFGRDAEAHIASLPSFRRSAHTLNPTASAQLDVHGYDRSRLRGVLVTHTHWDHVSGLDSLDVPVWINADELAYARAAKDDRVFMTVAEHHELRTYRFDGPAYLGFPASHDFYGDGSVVIVPAAGHTIGSVVVFVTTPDSRRYAFIGDLTWQLDGIVSRVERPLLMQRLADSDAGQVRDDLVRILAIADRYQVVPAHDARGYEGIPVLAARKDQA
jgi:N-acyl homoserine lactone hydrolase